MTTGKILVIRATGAQGVGVVKNLLRGGYTVHALVRDAADQRALALKSIGATLFEGSLDDPNAIARAAVDITGVFFNLMPSFTDDSEVRQAKSILEITKTAGASHVVYSSALRVGNWDESEHWDPNSSYASAVLGKVETEELVHTSSFEAWTVLKPGFFTSNFLTPLSSFMFPGLGERTEFVSSYRPDTILPLVDPNDIGAFATAAFLEPQKFGGHDIQVVSERLTVEAVIQILGEASGKTIKAIYRTAEETSALKDNPLISGQLLTLDLDNYANLEKVKGWGIPLTSFRDYLKNEHEKVGATFNPIGNEQVDVSFLSQLPGGKAGK
ncbi:NAD(P)-binding protein [Tothia fuscella]|uniref:NAD(P)-binding protein n=1 Tax=Tothia fuscella TaxID=1048955 RepID=A0A9P4U211_9PEZI|nr:NAD(P)-binding protein [Tothia fuscella]